MNTKIPLLIHKYLTEEMDAEIFSNAFFASWAEFRDSGCLTSLDPVTSEFVTSVFCLVDLYNPDADKKEHELTAEELRMKITQLQKSLGVQLENKL